MLHEFEDHLLSAYLDDELSADERALVEQRLEIDPAARELLEDLKRLRGLVSTLPGWKGADLQIRHPEQLTRSLDEQIFDEQIFTGAGPTETLPRKPDATDAAVLDANRSAREVHPSDLAVRAERRTQQSMRWTMIVAVAAGLATLVLGLPYLLRDSGPVTELARTGSVTQRPDATSDFGAAGNSALGSSVEDAPTSGPAELRRDLSREGMVSDRFSDSLELAPSDPGQRRAMTPAMDLDGVVVHEATSPVPADAARASRGVQLGTESSGLAVNPEPPARAESVANAPAVPGLAIPLPTAGAAAPATLDPSAKADALGAPSGSSLAGGAAGAPMSAAKSLPQASLSMAPADVAARAGTETEAAEAASVENRTINPEEPALFYAYSQAWTATEVDSAIKEVWSYVEPSVNAVAVVAKDETEQVRPMAEGQAARPSPGYERNASRYYSLPPAVTDTEASPAVGIASLPTNQSVTQWYEQLQPANRLAQLNRLSRSAAADSATSPAGQTTEPMTPLMKKSLSELERGRAKQNQVKTGDSLALFVTVGEARSILSTLDSQRQAETDAKYRANLNRQSSQAGALQGSEFFRQQASPKQLQSQQQLGALDDQQPARAQPLLPIQPGSREQKLSEKELLDQKSALELQVVPDQDAAKAQQAVQERQLPAEQLAAGERQRSAGREPAGNSEAAAAQGAKPFGSEPNTAAILPPAWWARSRVLLQQGESTDDAKVILILNQAPVR